MFTRVPCASYAQRVGAIAKERAQDRIAELSRRGHDLVTFWRECTELLEGAVPHYDKPCWYTLDLPRT